MLTLAEHIGPQTAARPVLEAAQKTDAPVAGLDRWFASQIKNGGHARVVHRARHRREHLDQIEAALRGGV